MAKPDVSQLKIAGYLVVDKNQVLYTHNSLQKTAMPPVL